MMNPVTANIAILYRSLPIEMRFETTNPQTIGPINDDARSARPKYAKDKLCFPFGATYAMTERDTAQREPNQRPITVVAMTKNVKFLRYPTRGKMIIYPESINMTVLLWQK